KALAQKKEKQEVKLPNKILERIKKIKKKNFTKPPAPTNKSSEAKASRIKPEINIQGADITAVIRIFSKKTGRNYIIDDGVKGKISLYLPGELSDSEAVKILDTILALKGFAAVPVAKNLWKVVPQNKAVKSTIPTITEEKKAPTSGLITRLIRLKYVSADDVQKIISPLISNGGLITAYTGTNSLIVIDQADNIERLLSIIRSLDLPFTNQELTIIRIKHAEAKDIADKLQQILGEGKKEEPARENLRSLTTSLFNRSRFNRRVGETQQASQEQGSQVVKARTKAPKIIADERTNSIIIVADKETTAKIRALVSKLDAPVDLSGLQFFVYRVKHGDAEQLANVLSGLTGGSTTSTSQRGSLSNTSLFSPTPTSRSFQRTLRSSNRLSSQRRTPGQPRQTSGPQQAVSAQIGENISITADPATNSLIIYASRADYKKVLSLLEQLDIKRRQVLVEAVLLEVGVDNNQTLGMDFLTSAGGKEGGVFAESNFSGNLSQLISNPTQLANLTIAAASSGTLTLPGNVTVPTQTIVLNAVKTNSNVNVLSAPTILATDNEQAEIVVGENVPFVASTSTDVTNLNNVFNQVDRQDVGITLRITPQINSDEFVTLNIFTEVSSVVAATLSSPLGPTTTVRTTQTTVIAKNNQMIVTGGLISDDNSESDTGVPILSDVPVLGQLFRTRTSAKKRSNLLIFITPRIIKDQYDAREQTIAHAEKTEKTIEKEDIVPKRDSVLHNPDINKVTEISKLNKKDFSTIKGSRSLSASTSSPLKLNTSLKISSEKKGRYIVLEALSSASKLPPFAKQPIKTGEKYGLILPSGVPEKALNFFSKGNSYIYQIGNEAIELKALSISSSQKGLPSVLNWYTLSPYEILHLGKGPWKKK
ncbi:MAG: type II secretion system protein GspD, partial [Candidatus Dadabacteria bacterium]